MSVTRRPSGTFKWPKLRLMDEGDAFDVPYGLGLGEYQIKARLANFRQTNKDYHFEVRDFPAERVYEVSRVPPPDPRASFKNRRRS